MHANSPPVDRAKLASEIEAAFREKRQPIYTLGDQHGWYLTLDEFLTRGRLEPVMHVAASLRAAFPRSGFAQNVCVLFERMPPEDENYLPFEDHFEKDVLIVRRENAHTVLLVFCGRAHRAGLPLCLLHRWLGRLPVSIVYLRDFHDLLYLSGIKSLGQDRDATLASLRGLVASLGGQRTLCYGNSGGVFAALHYGLDLGSDAVLCLSGIINISATFNAHLHSAKNIASLHQRMPHLTVDLRRAFLDAQRPPHARIVYAQNNWDDRLHADYLAGLPTVTLQAVPGTANHNIITDLIRRGEYQDLLDRFVSS